MTICRLNGKNFRYGTVLAWDCFDTGLFWHGTVLARDCFDMGLFRMGLFWHGTVLDGTVLTRDCFDMGLFWFGTVLVWDCLGGTVLVGLFWFGTVSYCSPIHVLHRFTFWFLRSWFKFRGSKSQPIDLVLKAVYENG